MLLQHCFDWFGTRTTLPSEEITHGCAGHEELGAVSPAELGPALFDHYAALDDDVPANRDAVFLSASNCAERPPSTHRENGRQRGGAHLVACLALLHNVRVEPRGVVGRVEVVGLGEVQALELHAALDEVPPLQPLHERHPVQDA